ncbi:DUF4190 domain-containing protein [Leucobacter tenebrionis]|uniref:DUF4190 domain-containing protein n=1 Tax=Leucobacter tenebrionis TaxID=2873270 RepID=UPI001CA65DA2|nr:DUF4190 domain-containing protein [Leucobacter tenebrionis]QZY52752.1 DUF4190 domain-containing protein [Leucobacter tenebrionis]
MTTPNPPQQPERSAPSPTAPQYSQTPQGGAPQASTAAPRYQQPAQQAPYRPQPATATTLGATNTYAVLAVIFGFLVPIAGIVFGHMGLSQIKRTGDPGRGLALTGLIVGYAYFALIAILIFLYISFFVMMFAAMGSAFSSSDLYY